MTNERSSKAIDVDFNQNEVRKMLNKVHRNDMFNCAINGKSCGYGICDECPVTIGTFSF